MLRPLDFLYVIGAILTAPVWLTRMIRTGRIRTDWAGRLGRVADVRRSSGRRVLIHAVSVGEVNAIRLLVQQLSAVPGATDVVIAVTTDTGFARARDLFGDELMVVRAPFDFSFAVHRFLDAVAPEVVVHVELEVWPNLTAECRRRGIPVAVVNGRLSERSFRRYRRITPLIRPMFRRLAAVSAQTQAYADRFCRLGTDSSRIEVTGTMKWDAVSIAVDREAAAALAHDLGIDTTRPLVVAGSTAPGEHELIHNAIPDGVQLLCAPRRPEWFDQAASDLPGCARRSDGTCGSDTDRFLLDTFGELALAYALADVVIVGRSFGDLHGSDMMEPIGLGKPTIVGPAVGDFQDTMNVLLAADGIVQVSSTGLQDAVSALLEDASRRRELIENGHEAIAGEQGATGRNVRLIHELLAGETSAR